MLSGLRALALIILLLLPSLLFADEEFFTVQLASAILPETAEAIYQKALSDLKRDDLDFLRIELIKDHYCVRIGKFKDGQEAVRLREIVKPKFPNVIIMSGYYLEDRIIKIIPNRDKKVEDKVKAIRSEIKDSAGKSVVSDMKLAAVKDGSLQGSVKKKDGSEAKVEPARPAVVEPPKKLPHLEISRGAVKAPTEGVFSVAVRKLGGDGKSKSVQPMVKSEILLKAPKEKLNESVRRIPKLDIHYVKVKTSENMFVTTFKFYRQGKTLNIAIIVFVLYISVAIIIIRYKRQSAIKKSESGRRWLDNRKNLVFYDNTARLKSGDYSGDRINRGLVGSAYSERSDEGSETTVRYDADGVSDGRIEESGIKESPEPLHVNKWEGELRGLKEPSPTPISSPISSHVSAMDFIRRLLPHQGSLTVGIDIAPQSVRFVMTTRGADSAWKVIDYKSVALGTVSSYIGDLEFIDVFRRELSGFISGAGKPMIWAALPFVLDNVYHFRIPFVPKAEIYNAVYWTMKKEGYLDEEKDVFDFEVRGEVSEKGVRKLSIVAYTVPKTVLNEIKTLFNIIKIPLEGIIIKTFAIQNIFRTRFVQDAPDTIVRLFIGNDFSRIDIYDGGELAMSRDVKTGIESLLDVVSDIITDRQQIQVESDETRLIYRELARKALANFDAKPQEGTIQLAELVVGKDEIISTIDPVLKRIIRQIERTLKYFTENISQKEIERLYISSIIDVPTDIQREIGAQLGVLVSPFSPLSIDNQNAGPAGEIREVGVRMGLVPALGVALSSNDHTPNLICTYKDKEDRHKTGRVNQTALAIFLGVIVVIGVIFIYLHSLAEAKNDRLKALKKEYSAFNPMIERDFMQILAAKYGAVQLRQKRYAQAYQGLAVIGDITALTPENIKFTYLQVNLGGVSVKKDAAQSAQAANKHTVSMTGYVIAPQNEAEAGLSDYVVRLNSSPLFKDVKAVQSGTKTANGREMLEFNINMEVKAF